MNKRQKEMLQDLIDNKNNQIKELQQENKQLKEKLENKYEKVGTLTGELLYEENTKLINQQKEFIKYLEDTIQKEQKNLDDLCDIYKVPKENNSTYKFLCSFVHRIEEILSKYKEIIGVSDGK